MSKWQQVNLGDAIDILSGYAFKSKDFCDKGVPVLKIQNVTNSGVLLNEDTVFVSEDTAAALLKYKIHYDDILITMTGSNISQFNSVVGRVSKVKFAKPAMLNQRVGKILLKDKDSFCLDYIFYFLSQESTKIKLAQKASGSANQANISPAIIKSLKIPMPPIEVQRKIADILSAYDDLIENNRKQIKLLEEAARRLYKEWFIDLRFPGHETTPIVNGIPEGWEKKKLGSIIKLRSGFGFKSKDFCYNGNFKIVTIKNVQDGVFYDKNTDKIVVPPANMPKHCLLSDGDILLSLTGNIGRICIVVGQNFLLNQRVAKIESQYPCFAYCLFRNKDFCDTINNLANGAAQQNLSPIKTEQMNIQIPPKYLLQKFETTTSLLLKKLQILCKDSNKLQESRDKILPKLMTGELEVK